MDVQVNWLAIVLATASSMVVGFIWYSKQVFGSRWQKLAGLSDKDLNDKKSMQSAMTQTIIASFVTAYVLAHVAYLSNTFFANSFLQDTLTTAFWLWLGFTAARIVTHNAFDRRPRDLTLMTLGNEFATIMVMGLIIGLLKP